MSRTALLLDPDAPRAGAGAKKERIYLGIDGEGLGRNPHRYVLLAAGEEPLGSAQDESRGRVSPRHWWVENPDGLSTLECLRFLCNLPKEGHAIFAYAFNYDLTKILQDIDNERLYRLFRPELRKRSGGLDFQGPAPVWWQGYELNLIGSKFTIRHDERLITIWDVWKFYQGKFVKALADWRVGNRDTQAETERMKSLRSSFRIEDLAEIRSYCFSECRDMATLAHKLVTAHEEAGLSLTSFYGAGSTASAMLKLMGIKEKLAPTPAKMKEAVGAAFFGGRFENSVLGEIASPVENWDISSAYPYQTCFLPCLLHGQWSHTVRREDLEGARTACVRYRLRKGREEIRDWAPFPFRGEDGSICFPSESGGGWVWLSEYLAGERFCADRYPGSVEFCEAWVYTCDCVCKPFEPIPHYYRERCRIGKEGAGIVFKLGPNSVYGKLAQSVGSARYQSWIWAGMITAGCRAQLLDLMALHWDRRNVLMVATDGLFTSEEGVTAPVPLDTGTAGTGKPLGGWERGLIPQGIFAARPGIYFPLNPTGKDLSKVKGRGVGKGTILDNHVAIVDAFKRGGVDAPVTVKDIERFCGAKTSISHGAGVFNRAAGGKGDHGQDLPFYGEWIKRRVEMSFDPMPKRSGVLPGDKQRLELRKVGMHLTSSPYKKAVRSPDAEEMVLASEELLEQPEGELIDTTEWVAI